MRLLTYQMPDELLTVASAGEFDEFDLNEFFAATDTAKGAQFKHKSDVQKWLDIIRGQYMPKAVEGLKTGSPPPFPYSDVRLLPYLQHSFWFLPNVAACQAMANLFAEKHNIFWHEYEVVVAAGASAGIGLDALPPVGDHQIRRTALHCSVLFLARREPNRKLPQCRQMVINNVSGILLAEDIFIGGGTKECEWLTLYLIPSCLRC